MSFKSFHQNDFSNGRQQTFFSSSLRRRRRWAAAAIIKQGVGQCNTRECAAASRQEGSPPPSPRNFFPYVLVVVSIQYRIGTKRREEGALVDIGVRLVSSSFDGKRFSVAPIIKVNTRYSIFSVRSVTTLFFIRKSDCK